MKYLNIKKALTAWQELQPLSEKDKDRLSRRFTGKFDVFGSARREALSQPPIGKPLEGAIYPSETKSLFLHFNVWNSWPFRWALTAISHHPTTFLFVVVLFKPFPKLGMILKVEKVDYSHNAISI